LKRVGNVCLIVPVAHGGRPSTGADYEYSVEMKRKEVEKAALSPQVENEYADTQLHKKEKSTMPIFMDIHKVDGANAEAVAEAHQRDLATQDQYGVNYLKYWFDETTGTIFCLAEAPDKEAAIRVHREAHGLVAAEIFEVSENS
jgi:hypothetical protein